ncbi:hypothetical protein GCM10023196_096870 [Actinoallomurus vinaceus]|uniref:Uncharacterized protein n=1 Tax=Actinoallomurus vinaceus TaxID=1080074 RepID=A0ABP8UU64_9ACTN
MQPEGDVLRPHVQSGAQAGHQPVVSVHGEIPSRAESWINADRADGTRGTAHYLDRRAAYA